MTLEERELLQRERDAKFRVPLVRCKYCKFTVPESQREAHLGRCAEVGKQGVSFARGAPMDEHFDRLKDR